MAVVHRLELERGRAFFNGGKIQLTNGDSCANNATLNLPGETLTTKAHSKS